MMGGSTKKRKSEKRGTATDLEKWAGKLQEAINEKRQEYVQSLRGLDPRGKAEAYLVHIAKNLESFGDQEAVVYLASRGRPCTAYCRKISRYWKDSAEKAIAACARKVPVVTFGKRRSRTRYQGGMSVRKARKIEERTRFELRDFWGFSDQQEFSMDATMLRTVEWCAIAGFDAWWERMARHERESILHGGVAAPAALYRLFNLCRSDFAVNLMGGILNGCWRPARSRISG